MEGQGVKCGGETGARSSWFGCSRLRAPGHAVMRVVPAQDNSFLSQNRVLKLKYGVPFKKCYFKNVKCGEP